MNKISVVRLVTGEDVVGEITYDIKLHKYHIKNPTQLVLVPDKSGMTSKPSYAFIPYPTYTFKMDNVVLEIDAVKVVFNTEIPDEFVKQYSTMFTGLVFPDLKIN